jgi:hypothetical protein
MKRQIELKNMTSASTQPDRRSLCLSLLNLNGTYICSFVCVVRRIGCICHFPLFGGLLCICTLYMFALGIGI